MIRQLFRIILPALILLSAATCRANATDITFGDEHLSYRVTYKWGFIHKVAGDARIDLTRRASDGSYDAVLTARTRPWADPIFSVRDTLIGHMLPESMAPTLYDKNSHEGSTYRRDVIRYTYHGNSVTARIDRFKEDKKGRITRSDTIMSALRPNVDMLSVYYFVRRLPFEQWKKGHVAKANIFSGAKIELLEVTYGGITTIKLDGHQWQCYEIRFSFSSERMRNSSAPMRAWIRTDGTRIPVKLEGELPIGKIQVLWNSDSNQK
ncbi:MAG: DUF3108 domain-containing protein [Muribaculaceae bacterium]|nr:DUF3108 domain-containing protein [Muribaculaceae bacterium]